MADEKGQSFLRGAAILSASTIIVKFVSFFFTIPLTNLLGTAGIAPYNTAYSIFGVFNAMATAGLPVAISKMVSSSYAMNNPRQAEKTFSVALRSFSLIGLALSISMFLFSDVLAGIASMPNASASIKALAPTVFFASVMACIRGFFQGKSNMKPTAASQLIESIVKLVIGLSLAAYVFKTLHDSDLASAAAILGVSISAGCGAGYLLLRRRKDKHISLSAAAGSRHVDSSRVILRRLFRLAVPITIGSCLLFVLDFIDVSIINTRLQTYLPKGSADNLYGSWGSAIKLFDLPGAVTIPIATSIIPVISVALTRQNTRKVGRSASSAMRMTLLITVPCAVGFFLFGTPLAQLAYPGKTASSDIIGHLLTVVSFGVIFNGLLYTTNSLLQAMGHVTAPVVNMAIGGVVRIVLNYTLVGMPEVNITGTAVSSVVSYLVTLILNLIVVYRKIPRVDNILGMFLPVALSSILMGAAAQLTFLGLCQFISPKIAVIPSVIVAVLVYFPAAILLKAIRPSELAMLPKGEKIAKKLHLYEGAHFE